MLTCSSAIEVRAFKVGLWCLLNKTQQRSRNIARATERRNAVGAENLITRNGQFQTKCLRFSLFRANFQRRDTKLYRGLVVGNRGLEKHIRFDTSKVRTTFRLLAKQSVNARGIGQATFRQRSSLEPSSSNRRAR